MICKNCGSVVSGDAEICYACGAPIVKEEEPREAEYTLDDAPETPERQDAEPLPPENGEVVVDNAQKAGIYARFFSFFFALIGWILYGVQRKNGEDAKAASIANAVMSGLCAKMVAIIAYILINYITHR